MTSNRAIGLFLAMLAGIIVLFRGTSLDFVVQDPLYDFTGHAWLMDRNAPVPRLLFYDLPKVLLVLLSVALLARVLQPGANALLRSLPFSRRQTIFLLLCLGLIPLTLSSAKRYTGIWCPYQITRYDGPETFRHLFDATPPENASNQCGRCFPAGHASGGFAMMSLFLVGRTRRERWLGWAAGFGLGWMMGLYQMFKGAHFLSHTLVTMTAAWILILILARLCRLPGSLSEPHRNRIDNNGTAAPP